MTQPAGDGFFPPRFRAEIWATRRVPTEASRSSDRERLLGSPCVDPAANRAQYFPPAGPTRAFPSPRMFTSKSPGDISARFLEPSFDLFASSREILLVAVAKEWRTIDRRLTPRLAPASRQPQTLTVPSHSEYHALTAPH